jgi:hypothetical protein
MGFHLRAGRGTKDTPKIRNKNIIRNKSYNDQECLLLVHPVATLAAHTQHQSATTQGNNPHFKLSEKKNPVQSAHNSLTPNHTAKKSILESLKSGNILYL